MKRVNERINWDFNSFMKTSLVLGAVTKLMVSSKVVHFSNLITISPKHLRSEGEPGEAGFCDLHNRFVLK